MQEQPFTERPYESLSTILSNRSNVDRAQKVLRAINAAAPVALAAATVTEMLLLLLLQLILECKN